MTFRIARRVLAVTLLAAMSAPAYMGVAPAKEPDEYTCDDPKAVLGTDGDDRLEGTRRVDIICGLGGDDVIIGKDGDDFIKAGGGSDEIIGGEGADQLRGLAGEDLIRGGPGADRLRGGSDRDVIHCGRGHGDTVEAVGQDTLHSC